MPWIENIDETRAVELFKAWFVKPMSTMDTDGGFVAFMVALALYERLIIAKLKLENSDTDKPAIKQKISEDLELSDHDRSVFWNLFRDGLLHQGMPNIGKTGFILHPNFAEKPKLKYDGEKPVFCIDPWKFYQRVIQEFLSNPCLITASESFPLAQVGVIQLGQLTDLPSESNSANDSPAIPSQNLPTTVTGVIKTDHSSGDGDPLT